MSEEKYQSRLSYDVMELAAIEGDISGINSPEKLRLLRDFWVTVLNQNLPSGWEAYTRPSDRQGKIRIRKVK